MANLGTDIGGVSDVSPTLAIVTGRRALAENILRRLLTPRGGLIGSPAYGYDLRALIGSTVPVSVVEQRVLEQVLAEEEVEDATATATLDASSSTLTVTLQVVDAEGPFELTVTASELRVEAFLDGELFAEAA